MYRLVFKEGPHKGRRLAVQQGSIVIGRDPECHIHLSDDEISWKHAVIEERGDGVYVRDLGSLNRIVLNDKEVREAKLNDGDNLVFGNTRIVYQRIRPVVVEDARRISHVQGLTFAAVALVLLMEIVFLAALSAYRVDQSGGLTEPLEGAVSEQEPAESEEGPELTVEVVEVAEVMVPPDIDEDEETTPEEPESVTEPEPEVVEAPQPADEEEVTVAVTEEEPDEPVAVAAKQEVEPEPEPEVEFLEESPPEEEPVEAAVDTEQEQLKSLDEARSSQPEYTKDDPLLDLSQEMLADALLELQKMNLVQADQQLARLQIVSPEYLPAYAERARLFEMRGMLKEAGEQWAELLQRAQGTPWHEYAAEERQRVAREENGRPEVRKVGKADERAKKRERLPKKIVIDAVELQKVSRNDNFDEMRLLNITVRPRAAQKFIQGEDTQLKVAFFDRERGTDAIHETRVLVPEDSLQFEGDWKLGERRTVSAAYIVPEDFRDREEEELGAERTYYGYVVRLYYDGILQDEEGHPSDLLDIAPRPEVSPE